MVEYVSKHVVGALPGDPTQNVSADAPASEQSRTRRSRRKPGENRERLLAAGLIEFGSRGFRGTATSHIATRADVPQPHIYSSFSTKHELFLACLSRTVDTLTVASGEPRAGAQSEAALHIPHEWSKDVGDTPARVVVARMVFQALAAVGEGGLLGEAIVNELFRLRSALTDNDFDQLILLASKSYLMSPEESAE